MGLVYYSYKYTLTYSQGFQSLYLLPPKWWSGGLIYFSENLCSSDLRQTGILGGNGTLSVGDFFQVGLENSLYIYKTSEYETQTKKIIFIVISTISHFWFSTLATSLYSVFVSLSSMVYSSPPETFFGGLTIFLYLVGRGCEKLKFLGDLLYWGT